VIICDIIVTRTYCVHLLARIMIKRQVFMGCGILLDTLHMASINS